jgi:hypothetical protein
MAYQVTTGRFVGRTQELARLGELLTRAITGEPLHWADRSTRDLLVFLATSLRPGRIMVVLTFRSDELHRLHPAARAAGRAGAQPPGRAAGARPVDVGSDLAVTAAPGIIAVGVGGGAGDRHVVEDRVAVATQAAEQAGGRPLPLAPSRQAPAAPETRNRSRQPAAAAAASPTGSTHPADWP